MPDPKGVHELVRQLDDLHRAAVWDAPEGAKQLVAFRLVLVELTTRYAQELESVINLAKKLQAERETHLANLRELKQLIQETRVAL